MKRSRNCLAKDNEPHLDKQFMRLRKSMITMELIHP